MVDCTPRRDSINGNDSRIDMKCLRAANQKGSAISRDVGTDITTTDQRPRRFCMHAVYEFSDPVRRYCRAQTIQRQKSGPARKLSLYVAAPARAKRAIRSRRVCRETARFSATGDPSRPRHRPRQAQEPRHAACPHATCASAQRTVTSSQKNTRCQREVIFISAGNHSRSPPVVVCSVRVQGHACRNTR